MSTKKGGGSTKNGRDSIGKRLGVKLFGGQSVCAVALLSVSEALNFTLARMSD